MLSIGLDYHTKLSVIWVLDENGKTILTKTIHGRMEIVIEELRKIKHRFRICFEASTGYGVLYEALSGLPRARRVIVADPGKIRLIFQSKRKTDRIDAQKLATLLFLQQLPHVYVPAVDIRSWRTMINHRNRVSDERKSAKNSIRAFLRHRGIVAPKSLWSKAGLAWLRDLAFDIVMDEIQRDNLVMKLDTAKQMLRRVEKELKKTADKHPGVALLRTIPGVGIRTAEAVVAYIDDPKRFSRTRCIGDYFGMVPELDASAGKYRYGHITKDGPPVVRKMITEAAWQGIRHSAELKARFEQYLRNDKQRRRIAIVAVGHFLLRVMITMLRRNEVWNPDLVVSRAG
jgi:transposase